MTADRQGVYKGVVVADERSSSPSFMYNICVRAT